MNEQVEKLKQWIEDCDNIVFFGGAGVSTESGIPDFRSVDGLYNQKYKYPPERILSHSFFVEMPAEFYKFSRDKLYLEGVKPNRAHIRLAELEAQGKLKGVVTQNIDGLHQDAGSKNVLELHGTIHRFYCTRCGKDADKQAVLSCTDVPLCSCGGVIRPDVVLYEEGLDGQVWGDAMRLIADCDMLIVGGTSLAVYPAASLVNYYNRKKGRLVLINKTPTPYDDMADLVIYDSLGEVFSKV